MDSGCPKCGLSLGPVRSATITCPRCMTLYRVEADGSSHTPAALGKRPRIARASAASAWADVQTGLLSSAFPLRNAEAAPFVHLGPKAVPLLLTKLREDRFRLVLGAAWLLRRFTDQAAEVAPGVADLLTHPHGLVRETARWVLRCLGGPAITVLKRRLRHPEHCVASAECLAVLGPRAKRALPALRAQLALLEPDREPEAEALRSAIAAIAGPWERKPKEPIPYLGEWVQLDARAPERNDEEAWLSYVEDQVQYFTRATKLDVYDLPGWAAAEKDNGQPIRVQWKPDQVVLARPSTTLRVLDHRSMKTTSTRIQARNRTAFTLGELLFQVRVAFARFANCPQGRTFEGLKAAKAPNAFEIWTGS